MEPPVILQGSFDQFMSHTYTVYIYTHYIYIYICLLLLLIPLVVVGGGDGAGGGGCVVGVAVAVVMMSCSDSTARSPWPVQIERWWHLIECRHRVANNPELYSLVVVAVLCRVNDVSPSKVLIVPAVIATCYAQNSSHQPVRLA